MSAADVVAQSSNAAKKLPKGRKGAPRRPKGSGVGHGKKGAGVAKVREKVSTHVKKGHATTPAAKKKQREAAAKKVAAEKIRAKAKADREKARAKARAHTKAEKEKAKLKAVRARVKAKADKLKAKAKQSVIPKRTSTILAHPPTAWMCFCNANRQKVQDQAEGQLKFGEVSKILGPMWRQLSAEEKRPYELQHQQAKRQYKLDLASLPEDKKAMIRKIKRKRRAEKRKEPAKNLSPYMWYVSSNRQELKDQYGEELKRANPGKTLFNLMGKFMGQKWSQMSDADKAPYVKKAEFDKARYEHEMKEWREKKAAEKAELKRQRDQAKQEQEAKRAHKQRVAELKAQQQQQQQMQMQEPQAVAVMDCD